MIDKKIISKRSKDCGMIRESKKAKKERQAEKLKKLKKWGNMKKKTPSAEDETNFKLIELIIYIFDNFEIIINFLD